MIYTNSHGEFLMTNKKIAGVPENEFICLGEFFERVQRACQGKDLDQVAQGAGVPRPTLKRWLDERYAPHPLLRNPVLARMEE